MTLKKTVLALFILVGFNAVSQTDGTIFTIENQAVSTSEFVRVYNKNIDIVTDPEQKGVKNYLDLYINYKLKVRQAQDLGLDTVASYIKELGDYKKQIMAPYLRDDEFIDKLVKEAYERSLIEINASHILVKVDKNSKDTIGAYKKIQEAYDKIAGGEDFSTIALQYSEDGSVVNNKGNLGYFSVFSMVYPFENAIYNTKKNTVSKPFRTRFGYHIVYINDIRKARGEVEAAHIMVKLDSIGSRLKIDELYQKLLGGADFSEVAKNFSDDTYSAKKGGELGKFGTGKMVPEFENVVFNLKNKGDFSEPFKTQYGWHIVKLLNKFPIQSFEEQEKMITAKVKRGDRASIVSNSIVYKIKDNYNIVVDENTLDIVKSGTWNKEQLKEQLMTLEGEPIAMQRLVNYLDGGDFSIALFNKFKNDEILEYYKLHLEETNQEFAYLFQEYKEGLLLFELMQQRIWEKSKDTIGLKAYFEAHKSAYRLPENVKVIWASSQDKNEITEIRKLFKKGISGDSIKKNLTSKSNMMVLQKVIESSDEMLPSSYTANVGVSKVLKSSKDTYVVVNTLEVIPAKDQNLDAVRGRVLSDYQEYLEEIWIEELHHTYTVSEDTKEIENLIARYSNE